MINDIVGIRRYSKTSLMFLTIAKLKREQCIYVNFEDRKLLPLTGEYFNAIIELIRSRKILNRFPRVYLFLDEVEKRGLRSLVKAS